MKKPSTFRTQNVEKSYWFTRFCGNFATCIHLLKKFKLFPREPHLFFKKRQIMNVLRILTVSVAFYSKIDTFSHFKKIQNFSENLFIFSKKQKSFEDSEKTANFSCIPLQNCYIQSFQSEFIFFGECMYFFETAKSLNVVRNVSVHSWILLQSCYRKPIFTISDFCSKNPFYILKKPGVWTSWGLLQFQSILR